MEGGFLDQLSDFSFSSSTSSQPIDELPAVVDINAPFARCLSGGIHIIAWDVQQGNFIVIKNDETKSMVIVDCGSSNLSYKKFEEMHMEEMINLFHGSKLDSVIITHPDKDHYSFLCEGLLQFVKQYDAISEEVTLAGEINSKFFKEKCDIGNGFSFCKPILVIQGKSSTNDQSLVFNLYCNGGRILFTGDATEKTFKAIGFDVKRRSLVSASNYKQLLHYREL